MRSLLSRVVGPLTVVLLGLAACTAGTADAVPSAATTTPPVTLTATAPPTAGAACTVEYVVTGSWPGGFGARVTVTASAAHDDWQVAWTFPAGQTVAEHWEATLVQDGARVVADAPEWAPDLAAGGSVSFGFNGAWEGSNPVPDDVTLDGEPCVPPAAAQSGTTRDVAGHAPASGATGGLWLDTDSQAYRAWQAATGQDAALLERIATTPQGLWVGSWDDAPTAAARVTAATRAAADRGETAVLVVYAIPGRDCGQHSAGGVAADAYARWVEQVAAGVVGEPIVVLEPDALAQLGDCDGQGDRVTYLRDAARTLHAAGARVYLDAGNAAWHDAAETARRIALVGTADLAGFALNVSNYRTTEESRAYGEAVSAAAGGLGFVVDTSRNGNGSDGQWCNPRGRALGERPRLVDDGSALDALLWVKAPGESDGTCNGGPAAGQWWQDVALEMARNAAW
ncbi:glycoside hydrolase family 6 protein [Cellulomonas sp. B6]|uniref:glycoside hydrolase family 6 protein n=1 Tax=Cellulomonas sp. B6 TaxID=1295626 RepID=UPI000A94CE7B|nr:glycoside hydrolase family 6 protein [Cellulomonas sp. B6]